MKKEHVLPVILISLLLLGSTVISCTNPSNNDNGNGNQSMPSGMYVAGYYSGARSAESSTVGCYWVDGTRYNLLSGSSDDSGSLAGSCPVGIAVVRGKIYAAGISGSDITDEKTYKAWSSVNGVKTDLHPEGALFSRINGMTVAGGKVYLAGYYKIQKAGKWVNVGSYWVDGVRHDIDDVTYGFYDIAVENGDIYVIGHIKYQPHIDLGIDGSPSYWVNGEHHLFPIDLLTGGGGYQTYAWLNRIAVEDGKVYAVGRWVNSPSLEDSSSGGCYWTPTEMVNLDPGRGIRASDNNADIAVENGTVYTIGNTFNGYIADNVFIITENSACYWINGEIAYMEGSDAYPSAMVVRNGKVYAAGRDYSNGFTRACVWIDGKRRYLNGDTADAVTFEE